MDWCTETARTSSRNRSRRPVLRREQREELDIYHHQDWTTDEQREQLENHHREDWTTDSSRKTSGNTPLGHSGRIALRREQCDVFGRIPSLLGNLKLDTLVVARQLKVKHFHGYAHHSVLSRCMVA
jgi:hypothetical protein